MTGLRVDEVRDVPSLAPLREEWRALVASAPRADIFQTWEWVSAWLDSFWHGKPLAFLFVRDGGRLVGILPLVHDVEGVLGCRGALALPVNPHVRRMDVISTVPPAPILDAALDHLRRTRRHVRVAVRQSLADSPAVAALPAVAARQGLSSHGLDSFPSPMVRIGQGWEGYLASRAPRVRRELRRKVKNAEERAGLTWAVLAGAARRAEAMEAVFAIERKCWKEQAGTSFTAEEGLVRFYGDVATSFADAGWLRVFLLFSGTTPVAHIFGAVYRRQYYAIKTSYDSTYRELSPGQVLFHHALRDSFEGGLEAFDFLGNPARWKDELANDVRRHSRVCAFSLLDPQCRLCELLDVYVRPAARRILATGILPRRRTR